MSDPLKLTLEQEKKVAQACPASTEGTMRNAIADFKHSYGMGGLLVGMGAGAFLARNKTGLIGGGFIGLVGGEFIGKKVGAMAGEELVADGIKQADEQCIVNATYAFKELNKAQHNVTNAENQKTKNIQKAASQAEEHASFQLGIAQKALKEAQAAADKIMAAASAPAVPASAATPSTVLKR